MMNTNPVTTGPVAGVDTHSDTHTLAVLTAQVLRVAVFADAGVFAGDDVSVGAVVLI